MLRCAKIGHTLLVSLRVVLVDDHPAVRKGYRRALEKVGHDVVGEAADGRAALDMIDALTPDVVVMDVVMPRGDGYDATREIRKRHPAARILVVSVFNDLVRARRFSKVGAMGFLSKDAELDEFREAVKQVGQGVRYFVPDPEGEVDDPASVLSPREFQVMLRLARGMTNREIAEEFFVSVRTVDNQRLQVLRKLGLRNNVELTHYAIRHALIEV